MSRCYLTLATIVVCAVIANVLVTNTGFKNHFRIRYFLNASNQKNTSSFTISEIWSDTLNHSSLPPSLSEYVRWHKDRRSCLINDSCDSGAIELLMWRCPLNNTGPCAGVGDRFRGLQFSLLLAIITKRLFLIDWPSDPFPLEVGVYPADIDWRVPDGVSGATWPEIDWFSCVQPRPCLAAGHLPSDEHLPAPKNLGSDINLSSANLSERLSITPKLIIVSRATESSFAILHGNTVAISGYDDLSTSNISSMELQRLLLQVMFKPSPSTSNALDDLIPSDFKKFGYTAIHARTGFDVGEGKAGRFRNINSKGQHYALKMLECALKINSTLDKRIYLASDSTVFKKLFTSVVKKYGVTVIYSSVPGYHFGLKASKSLRLPDKEIRKRFVNVFADFFGMATATVIITNGSGFARMAYLLGRAEAWGISNPEEDKCT